MFDGSPHDPMMRSTKELIEGTQRVQVDWTTTKKVVGVRLVEALASRDGPSRGHSRSFSLWDGADSFETSAKNLKVF